MRLDSTLIHISAKQTSIGVISHVQKSKAVVAFYVREGQWCFGYATEIIPGLEVGSSAADSEGVADESPTVRAREAVGFWFVALLVAFDFKPRSGVLESRRLTVKNARSVNKSQKLTAATLKAVLTVGRMTALRSAQVRGNSG